MKVLFLTKYDNLAASSRLRAYQYRNKMDEIRFEVDVKPLLSNNYLTKKFNNKRIGFFYLAYLFIKRIVDLVNFKKYDSIIIHLELFPFLPPFFEWLLFKSSVKIYFDYDDAIYHNYDMSQNFFIRLFLGPKIKYLMKNADGIIAGNNYTEKYAQNAGATNILVLPTVIDINDYLDQPSPISPNKNFTIGWIGSPSTAKYLKIVKEPLKQLAQLIPVTLYLVGANKTSNLSIDNVQIISVEWSEENEQKALKEFDVGIMPLNDRPWDMGKCAFKLIQYMASFLPVVSSNVGMNREIINDNGNGLLASSSDEWFNALNRIYLDNDLRKVMGTNGRRLIEKDFTIQSRVRDFENFIDKNFVQQVKSITSNQETDKLMTLKNYSVVTIGLNCASTVSRTIESVLAQRELPKQYIFVLGESKDDSYNLILSFKNTIQDKGIEFILIKEKEKSIAGIPVAWNLGINNVEADIIAILNADDYYPSANTMSIVLDNFNRHKGCEIVSGRIIYTGTNKIQNNKPQMLFPFLNPYNHPATFIAKTLYDKIGLYSESYIVSADYDFLYRAFSLGYNFCIDEKIRVSMEPGGFASQNKKIGRYEQFKIASSYTSFNIFPRIAFIIRFLLGR
mgnify:CR=1 FL=1|jgi:glycosyltransferase involved in cell wall biosynthesis